MRGDWGLTILRVFVGIMFAAHGGQKFFWMGIGTVAEQFAKSNIPLPTVSAAVVTLVELVGGLALVFGFFTRIAAVLLAIDMLGAFIFVHGKNGFFLPAGFEYVFILFGACVCLALAGPGAAALDRRVRVTRTTVSRSREREPEHHLVGS